MVLLATFSLGNVVGEATVMVILRSVDMGYKAIAEVGMGYLCRKGGNDTPILYIYTTRVVCVISFFSGGYVIRGDRLVYTVTLGCLLLAKRVNIYVFGRDVYLNVIDNLRGASFFCYRK